MPQNVSQGFSKTRSDSEFAKTEADSTPPLAVKIFRDFDWRQIRDAWDCWAEQPSADRALYRTIHAWQGADSPYVMVLFRSNEPDAMLVGSVQRTSFSIKVGPWGISPEANVLEIVYGGVLGNLSAENCARFTQEILRSLDGGEADLATFTGLRLSSPLYQHVLKSPGFLRRDHVRQVMNRWGATLSCDPETIYRRFSSHRRSELRRKIRKFANAFAGRIRIHCFRDRRELDTMMTAVEHIARKSFQRSLGKGLIDSPDTRRWLWAFADQDMLRCYILYVDERPVVFWLGSLYKGTFHGNYMAYDPEFNRHSPGVFLMLTIMEQCCVRRNGEHVSYIDFGVGDFPYKTWLCDDQFEQASVHIFARNRKGLYLNALHTPLARFDQAVRRGAAQFGMLNGIRKFRRAVAHLRSNAADHAGSQT